VRRRKATPRGIESKGRSPGLSWLGLKTKRKKGFITDIGPIYEVIKMSRTGDEKE
jgi:hypothetical protein